MARGTALDHTLYEDSYILFEILIPSTETDTSTKNVHEGPMGIGTRREYSEVAIAAGNVLSDGNHTHRHQASN